MLKIRLINFLPANRAKNTSDPIIIPAIAAALRLRSEISFRFEIEFEFEFDSDCLKGFLFVKLLLIDCLFDDLLDDCVIDDV